MIERNKLPALQSIVVEVRGECAILGETQFWKSISSYLRFSSLCRRGCLHLAGGPRVDAWASAAIVAMVSLVALIAFREWEEWVTCFLGLWIFAVDPGLQAHYGYVHQLAYWLLNCLSGAA